MQLHQLAPLRRDRLLRQSQGGRIKQCEREREMGAKKDRAKKTYFNGAGQSALNRNQHGALAGRVSQLRRCAADERDHAGGVDDAAALFAVFAESEHRVLGAEPDAFDVDSVREVPDFFYEWWRAD